MNDILNKLEHQANFNLTVCDDLKNIDENPKFKSLFTGSFSFARRNYIPFYEER